MAPAAGRSKPEIIACMVGRGGDHNRGNNLSGGRAPAPGAGKVEKMCRFIASQVKRV